MSCLQPLVFDGVTVIDVTNGRHLAEQTVVIMGNRIQLIGLAGNTVILSNALVIDARGKYLIPGLWDMHVHPRRLAHVFYPMELATYVVDGLPPLGALQSATLNPARMLHATDSLGTLAPSMLADLALLDADPLMAITNITTIRAVVANGRYFDRAALDQLLRAAQVWATPIYPGDARAY